MAHLKAQSFLGCITIRFGAILIALLQVLFGVCLYLSFNYLRPSLHGVAWTMLLLNCTSAIIGIIGAYKRNQTVEIVYLASYLICLGFVILTVLNFADVVQLMPKAPEGATTGFVQLERSFVPSQQPMFRSFNKRENVSISPAEQHAMLIQVLQHLDNIPLPDIEKYEDIPWVPKPNETEGESEEVGTNELPPEAKHLSKDSQDEITAIVKMQKRPIKLAMAGFFGIIALFEIYCVWILVTFIMNKCMSFDELTGAPEQFQALVGFE